MAHKTAHPLGHLQCFVPPHVGRRVTKCTHEIRTLSSDGSESARGATSHAWPLQSPTPPPRSSSSRVPPVERGRLSDSLLHLIGVLLVASGGVAILIGLDEAPVLAVGEEVPIARVAQRRGAAGRLLA